MVVSIFASIAFSNDVEVVWVLLTQALTTMGGMLHPKCKRNVGIFAQNTYSEAIKTVMLGFGDRVSINAGISCSLELEGCWSFCFFGVLERPLLPLDWGSGGSR